MGARSSLLATYIQICVDYKYKQKNRLYKCFNCKLFLMDTETPTWIIVCSSIGGILLLGFLIFLFFYKRYRKRQNNIKKIIQENMRFEVGAVAYKDEYDALEADDSYRKESYEKDYKKYLTKSNAFKLSTVRTIMSTSKYFNEERKSLNPPSNQDSKDNLHYTSFENDGYKNSLLAINFEILPHINQIETNSILKDVDDTYDNKVFDAENCILKSKNDFISPDKSDTFECFSKQFLRRSIIRKYDKKFKNSPESIPNFKYSLLNSNSGVVRIKKSINYNRSDPIRGINYHSTFKRSNIQLIRKIGEGNFGKAIYGEGRYIIKGYSRTQFLAIVMKNDQNVPNQLLFLQQSLPYEEIKHVNVIKFLGRCVDKFPYILLYEWCPMGNLKTFLKNSKISSEITTKNIIFCFSIDIINGVIGMNDFGFIHSDLSTRSCMIGHSMRIKIGDYGNIERLFPNDYMTLENGQLAPIRWIPPENIISNNVIQIKEATYQTTIWMYGIVLWELLTLADRPFNKYSDMDTIYQILKGSVPEYINRYNIDKGRELYEIMLTCWRKVECRPTLEKLKFMIECLQMKKFGTSIFNYDDHTIRYSFDKMDPHIKYATSPILPKRDITSKISNQLGSLFNLSIKRNSDTKPESFNYTRLSCDSKNRSFSNLNQNRFFDPDISMISNAISPINIASSIEFPNVPSFKYTKQPNPPTPKSIIKDSECLLNELTVNNIKPRTISNSFKFDSIIYPKKKNNVPLHIRYKSDTTIWKNSKKFKRTLPDRKIKESNLRSSLRSETFKLNDSEKVNFTIEHNL
ncbi:hypothetical protein A3Q56_05091 [Intoshia linei]|uniref:Protein kinase domain-containing protein n=1 Tax=Intoshia linei TaxID=1819745 RepID=A0A177AYV1_9BILA|nr:hypothetical protein A3Q56_05091 [Intoshia linei]